jgi:F-type H+-transporting ATPase subunit epsilon
MADEFQFDLVAPERRLSSLKVTSVQIPGSDGDMTVMAGHAPVITTLRPGVLRVEGAGGTQEYVITGGFAEVSAEGIIVLAERSLPRQEMTQEVIDQMVREAHEAHAEARQGEHHGVADDTAKLLADMVAMGSHIGLDPKQPNL